MRKLIFLTSMVLLNIFCAAQDTANSKGKLVSEQAHWTEITTNLCDSSYVEIDNYDIDGDTAIHATEYLNVYRNNKLYAGLRENEDHEVYVYFYHKNKEYLLYDFSWELGDTLCYEPSYYIHPQIDSSEECIRDSLICCLIIKVIDSIKLNDGHYYKYIPGGTSRFGNIYNIKDIGRNDGIFSHMFLHPADGTQFSLWSFYNGNKLIYKHKSCCPYVHKRNMNLLPQNPTHEDDIYLTTHLVTDFGGRCLGYQVSETDTQINVEACYWKDFQTLSDQYIDTISLGKKKPGDYKVKFSAYLSSNPESCTREDTSTFTLDFTVSPASKIQPTENQYEISCYPNPSTGKITFRMEQNPKPLKLLQIYSSSGRLVYSTAINNRKQIIVNKLPAGSYFYKITGENNLIYHSDQLVIIK